MDSKLLLLVLTFCLFGSFFSEELDGYDFLDPVPVQVEQQATDPEEEERANRCSELYPSASSDMKVADGLCLLKWATSVYSPRGLRVLSNGDVVVLSKRSAEIILMWDDQHTGQSGSNERVVLASVHGLNHAVVVDEVHNFLYASTSTSVYRWHFTVGERTRLSSPIEVVKNIPCCHHVSRGLEVNADGDLFVQVGSGSNVDTNNLHAMIHVFKDLWSDTVSTVDWNDLGSNNKVWAQGMRNEVGIRLDKYNQLWGVENGVDNLYRPDLGGDIHETNPCEELNLFPEPSGDAPDYGYPYCWSEHSLSHSVAQGKGTQRAQREFMTDQGHVTDSWCQSSVVKPKYCFDAHMAPMDLTFYYPENIPVLVSDADSVRAFPSRFEGSVFISFHGSWDRREVVGHNIAAVPIVNQVEVTQDSAEAIMGPSSHFSAKGGYSSIRPVGLDFGSCGSAHCLFFAAETTNTIYAIAPA
eukprot:CAMPEP_0174260988 /NCGR_PEP_ID=MMETSP0439-20130205/11165_1 /TAXON_ID=0 /ORGANISM="Stereomyxa ramosa, Strain Chinc5" /LENGTH=468 /DNA_ID=CAMNT_0015345385 /DNA_START=1 /DNA_END=1407 /DNA_ORIENTATION=-